MEKLNGKQLPFVVENEQNYAVLTRTNKNDETILAACNLNFDPAQNFAIRCAEKPENISVLTPEGKWENIKFEWKDGTAYTGLRMECYAVVILKIK